MTAQLGGKLSFCLAFILIAVIASLYGHVGQLFVFLREFPVRFLAHFFFLLSGCASLMTHRNSLGSLVINFFPRLNLLHFSKS